MVAREVTDLAKDPWPGFLGVAIETALAATILLRGLTFWLPEAAHGEQQWNHRASGHALENTLRGQGGLLPSGAPARCTDGCRQFSDETRGR